MFKQIRIAVVSTLVLTIGTGLLYPFAITGLAQVLFPWQANGSLIYNKQGKAVGSHLIGQPFDDPKYFWSRPSATGPFAYNASNSSGSNLGPTNPDFISSVKGRVDALKKADPDMADAPVPMDLVTASGSGLDPHISLAGAQYQANRVAKARKLDMTAVEKLIDQNTAGRWLGFIGDPGVNVVKLNLALDSIK